VVPSLGQVLCNSSINSPFSGKLFTELVAFLLEQFFDFFMLTALAILITLELALPILDV
jgi:hypothetical protein